LLTASFEDNPDNPVSECKTVLDFAAARDEENTGGDNRKYANIVSVKNHQHQHPVSFYRPDALLSPSQQCRNAEGQHYEPM